MIFKDSTSKTLFKTVLKQSIQFTHGFEFLLKRVLRLLRTTHKILKPCHFQFNKFRKKTPESAYSSLETKDKLVLRPENALDFYNILKMDLIIIL